MSTIVAGHFQLQAEIDNAREELMRAGFPEDRISAFFLNQPEDFRNRPAVFVYAYP